MFAITCPRCRRRELLSTRRIDHLHPGPDGMLGVLRCAANHTLVHDFGRDRTTSLPG